MKIDSIAYRSLLELIEDESEIDYRIIIRLETDPKEVDDFLWVRSKPIDGHSNENNDYFSWDEINAMQKLAYPWRDY
jgi:hypothetical protein